MKRRLSQDSGDIVIDVESAGSCVRKQGKRINLSGGLPDTPDKVLEKGALQDRAVCLCRKAFEKIKEFWAMTDLTGKYFHFSVNIVS